MKRNSFGRKEDRKVKLKSLIRSGVTKFIVRGQEDEKTPE